MKLAQKTFKVKIEDPRTKIKEFEVRPYNVGEQKIMLMASESGSAEDISEATKTIIKACIVHPKNVNVSKLPSYICEYLLLKIRAASAGDSVSFEFKHVDEKNKSGLECSTVTPVILNLADVEIAFPRKNYNKIDLSVGIVEMLPPTFADAERTSKTISEGKNTISTGLEIIAAHLDSYTDKSTNEVHDFSTDSMEQKIEFIESLNENQFAEVLKFFKELPTLRHTLAYKCAGCGQEDTYVLEGLQSFF